MSFDDAPPAGDTPIKNWRQDRLGRRGTAINLAAEYKTLNASEGYVTALMGPWGAGKTSLVNLLREELRKEPAISVLDFNPWMFSGVDALVSSFFREISAQIRGRDRRKFSKLADELLNYGELLGPFTWLPVVGAWAGRLKSLSGALRTMRERDQKSVHEQRLKLAEALAELKQSLVIVIDDIDRLSSAEIQDIFKLVRLTANFPNIIYVLVFDRARVEAALEMENLPGRNYLEKIVQSSYDLPEIPEGTMWRELSGALQKIVDEVGGDERFESDRWPDLVSELILPHIATMRDVRRFAASVRPTVASLSGQVELGDLLTLEAFRVFEPEIFRQLARMIGALTTPGSWGGGDHHDAPHKAEVGAILALAGKREELVKDLIRRVFPAAIRHFENNNYGSDWQNTWLRARLAAHPDILRLYLERVAPSGLSAYNDGERAFALLEDSDAFSDFLAEVEPDRREEVIAALEIFEGEYPIDAVPSAIRSLFALKPTLPERPRGFLDVMTGDVIVDRVVIRMLRQYSDQQAVEATVLEIWEDLGLSDRLDILRLLALKKPGEDAALAGKAFLDERRNELAADVDRWGLSGLAREPRLRGLLHLAAEQGGVGIFVSGDEDPDVHRAILRVSMGEVRSQTMGTRHVRRSPSLDWKFIEQIYGSKDCIKAANVAVQGEFGEGERELTDLVDKYLAGYRPQDFDSWSDLDGDQNASESDDEPI